MGAPMGRAGRGVGGGGWRPGVLCRMQWVAWQQSVSKRAYPGDGGGGVAALQQAGRRIEAGGLPGGGLLPAGGHHRRTARPRRRLPHRAHLPQVAMCVVHCYPQSLHHLYGEVVFDRKRFKGQVHPKF